MSICNTLGGLTEYEIHNANRTMFLRVVPEAGGIATSLISNGNELLYFDKGLLLKKDIRAGGVPFLFPVCGDLPGDRYNYKGKEYFVPSHGFARNLPWEVIGDSTIEQAEIKLKLKSGENTLDFYPFKFEVVLHYVLLEDSLIIYQTYKNCGDELMPFYSGFHPYFTVVDKNRLEFDIAAREYTDNTSGKIAEYAGQVDFNNPVDFIFPVDRVSSVAGRMTDKARGGIIEVQTSEEFKTLVLWTEADNDFICLEPWMAGPNAMNTGEGLHFLDAGSELTAWVKILIKSYHNIGGGGKI